MNSSASKAALLLIILAVFLLGYVWIRTTSVVMSYKYGKLAQEERVLSEEQTRLRLELASLKAPERLIELATKNMKFKKPDSSNRVIVRLERVD